jgi:hypothetical protein
MSAKIGCQSTPIEQISGVCGAGSRDNGRGTFEVGERKFLSDLVLQFVGFRPDYKPLEP